MIANVHRLQGEDEERNPRGGRPREPHSYAGQVRECFEANPNLELGYSEIAARFGMARNTAYNVVRQLEQQGFVEAVFVVRLVRPSARKQAA